jgi:serine O-acetyltransferase
MKALLKKILFAFHATLLFPAILLMKFHGEKDNIRQDIDRWIKNRDLPLKNNVFGFVNLLAFYKECRNVFYYRIGKWRYFTCFFYPAMPTAFIYSGRGKIGPGFDIAHGTSVHILAKSIGQNCTVFQNVTIGSGRKGDLPVIGNNAWICAGANVLGGITLGDNVIVGAGTTVTKNIESNSTVASQRLCYIMRDGEKVDWMPV